MNILIDIFDKILFTVMAVSVFYLFIFAFFSLWDKPSDYKPSKRKSRIVVLIPAYKEDKVILDSVASLTCQDYPENKLDIVVISDKMQDDTNSALSKLPIKLFIINPLVSSKAFAMNCAIEKLGDVEYEIVIILDADNTVEDDFIKRINDVYNSGIKAIQAHRKAKSLDNDMAVLDAISEEINNSIYRRGHTLFGLSSALIGSGMALDYKWFKRNVGKLVTAGEDKELELLLFKEGIYVEYINDLPVYDEKVKKEKVFYNQRRRWIATQTGSLLNGLKGLPEAIVKLRVDYIDKVFQWLLLPRILMLGLIFIVAVLLLIIDWKMAVKWLVLLFTLLVTFAIAIPEYLATRNNFKSIRKIPIIFLLMLINLFRTKGVNKKFIHTQKG